MKAECFSSLAFNHYITNSLFVGLNPGPLIKVWHTLTACPDMTAAAGQKLKLGFYYPPRDVFALNTGKYRPGCIFFVYTGAPVLWILSVINFRFFNNISESM